MILALDPGLFLILLTVSCAAMLIFNYPVAMPLSAAALFPIMYGWRKESVTMFAISAALSVIIVVKHFENLRNALNDKDVRIREYVKDHIKH